MKLWFRDGRPFMWVTSIFPYICELEFGNPAFETMNAVAITFATGFFVKDRLKNQEHDITLLQKLGVCLGFFLGSVIIIIFSMQGIYNGTNSIDGVLFGAELGLFSAMYSHFFLRKRIDKQVTKLMDGLVSTSYKKAKLGFTFGFSLLFLVITFQYVLCMINFEPHPAWIY